MLTIYCSSQLKSNFFITSRNAGEVVEMNELKLKIRKGKILSSFQSRMLIELFYYTSGKSVYGCGQKCQMAIDCRT